MKMNVCRLILLFFVFSIPSFASDTTLAKQRRFIFGINASGEYCSRLPGSEGIFAYSAGANVKWKVRDFCKVSIGFQYSQKGWMGNGYDSQWGQLSNHHLVRRQYNYLGIPVGIEFTPGTKKVRPLLLYALTPSFLLHQRDVKIYQNGGKAKKPFNYIYNPFNLFALVGFGVEIRTKKSAVLQILPTFEYGILQTNSNTTRPEHLYSYGLRLCRSF